MKRTPWFDARKTCPKRPGVYETRINGLRSDRREWTGNEWYFVGCGPSLFIFLPNPQWRGLAREP